MEFLNECPDVTYNWKKVEMSIYDMRSLVADQLPLHCWNSNLRRHQRLTAVTSSPCRRSRRPALCALHRHPFSVPPIYLKFTFCGMISYTFSLPIVREKSNAPVMSIRSVLCSRRALFFLWQHNMVMTRKTKMETNKTDTGTAMRSTLLNSCLISGAAASLSCSVPSSSVSVIAPSLHR